MQHNIICLVGPSGSGKTAICEKLMEVNPKFQKVRTTTTRKPRPNEDENAYFFITKEEFQKGNKEGIFLETSEYAGEMYGTPKFAVDAILESDGIPIVPIDLNGALAYKELYPDYVTIVFVYRDKRTIIEAIVERDIPIAEKSKRIIQLDKEFENITFCDRCVINNGTIEESALVVASFEKE